MPGHCSPEPPMDEHILFLTGHLAEPRLRRGAGRHGRDLVRLGDPQPRREGRGADDPRDRQAPAGRRSRATRVRPARPLQRRSRRARPRISGCRSCAGPRRSRTCPSISAAAAAAATSRATTAGSSPRSSRRRGSRSRRSWPGRALPGRGCRRHRSRLPARHALPASRGGGRGARRGRLPVSVDSADPEELRRGGRAGAGFLLSLTEDTLDLAFEARPCRC